MRIREPLLSFGRALLCLTLLHCADLQAAGEEARLEWKKPTCIEFLFHRPPINPKAVAHLRSLGIEADKEAWWKLQFPEGRTKDSKTAEMYVKNVTLGLTFFADYFQGSIHNQETFEKVLREQHAMMVLGDGTDEIYGGNLNGDDWKAPIDAIFNMASKIGEPFTEDDIQRAYLEEEQRIYRNADQFRTEEVSLEITDLFRDGHYGDERDRRKKYLFAHMQTKVQIDGLSEEIWPTNESLEDRDAFHYYALLADVPKYLVQMHVVLEKIHRCNQCSLPELSSHLANYFQIGINAHLFSRVSFSMLMAQVNYILLKNGFKGIDHSARAPFSAKFDMYALFLNSDEFAKIFVDEVLRTNSP